MALAHTTGLPNWRWIENDKKLRFKFEPGARYGYSGEGLQLLQLVVETITGKGLVQLSEERVFRPLKMAHTSYVWQPAFEAKRCPGLRRAGATPGKAAPQQGPGRRLDGNHAGRLRRLSGGCDAGQGPHGRQPSAR